ncbi:MAG: chemotaxis protein CheR [Betaproteobacteria bacterium]|nr:chemotaxis protein CheR [Betaproteobacteria bacterium]
MGAAETAVTGGDFEFTDRDFEKVCKLIYARAGISLKETKRQMVYSRLGRRLRILGLARFGDYLDRLEARNDTAEWEEFTNALTTNLTAFFREQHHFPALAELLQRAAARASITLWCSASSTGEEPYSMAMTTLDTLGRQASKVRILATDVDTNVLDKAKAGIYPMERLERLPEGYAKRFFLKGAGAQDGYARVRPELREMITFRQINLLDEQWSIRGPLDGIFCRNVMIYFDKSTQRAILERFHPLLRPDALLFMGHSESLHHATDLFRLRGKTVYQPLPGRRHG